MDEIKPLKLEEQEEGETHFFRLSIVPLVLKLVLLYLIVFFGYLIFCFIVLSLKNSVSLQTFIVLNIFLIFFASIFIGGLSIYLTLSWLSRIYIIKYPDIIARSGVLTIVEERTSLEGLGSDVIVTQGPFGKLFRYGNIQIGEFKVADIPDPHHFAEVVTGKKEETSL